MKKQSKRKNKNNKNSSFGFIQIFLILVFVAGMTFLCLSLFTPSKVDHEDAPLNTVVNNTDQKKKETKIPEKKEEGENPEKTPKQNEDTPTTDTKEINLSLTKNEVVGDKYMLRINIYEEVANGTCELEMKSTKGDYVKRSAKVIEAGADYASCEGFDILTSGIASGNYSFTVKVTIGDRTKSLTGNIKI